MIEQLSRNVLNAYQLVEIWLLLKDSHGSMWIKLLFQVGGKTLTSKITYNLTYDHRTILEKTYVDSQRVSWAVGRSGLHGFG